MPDMTCDVVKNLAAIFLPIIRWDGNERFFPVQAESWLTHCSHEDWEAPSPDSPKQRGTALLRLKPNATMLEADDVLARCRLEPGPFGGFVTVGIRDQVGDDPSDIGNPRYSRPQDFPDLQGADLFLDVGGWNSPRSLACGVELTYLEQLFSTLGNQLNPSRVAKVTLGPQTAGAPPPDFGITPQPPTATVYAEVESGRDLCSAGRAAYRSDGIRQRRPGGIEELPRPHVLLPVPRLRTSGPTLPRRGPLRASVRVNGRR